MRLVVSAILLFFMTSVASAFLFYGFVTGLIGTFIVNPPKTFTPLHLESASVNTTCITASVRNVGSVDVTITEAYVDKQPHSLTQTVHIASDSLGTVYITGAYEKGATYAVELVCSNGYSVAFDVAYD